MLESKNIVNTTIIIASGIASVTLEAIIIVRIEF